MFSDEGIGVHVLNALRDSYPNMQGVRYVDGGTLSFSLATEVEDADKLIVIDAAWLNQAVGAVDCFIGDEMDRFLGTCKCSAHEVSLIDLLTMARLASSLPEQRALIGIQPEKLDWGLQPSKEVAKSIPQAVDLVMGLLHQWQVGVDHEYELSTN